MKIYVVRHAHAGSRSAWDRDDAERPLSKKGHRQAVVIADRLVDKLPDPDKKVIRLLSSPAVRCTQTLGPLSRQLGSDVSTDTRLAEGSSGTAALALIDEIRHEGGAAVLCSHGDVIPELLGLLRIDGATFHDPFTWPKGSVWTLSGNGKTWTDARLWVPTS